MESGLLHDTFMHYSRLLHIFAYASALLQAASSFDGYGFSIVPNDTKKRIYDGERYQDAENINAIGIHPKEQQIEDHSGPQATATAPRMPQLVVGRP